MVMIISLIFCSMVLFACCAGAFLRIRLDIEALKQEKEEQIELVQRFLSKVVTHDDIKDLLRKIDAVVTQEDMKKYVDELLNKTEELTSLRERYQKDKWKNLREAFGGKKDGED